MKTNTAESFLSAEERKRNGYNGFKVTTRLDAENRPTFRSYWRFGTDRYPAFCIKLTYH
jgi:hypothetical protein